MIAVIAICTTVPSYLIAQPGSTITDPDWARRPTGEDIARLYPGPAQRFEIEGTAVISCRVRVDGKLEDCSVTSEAPNDIGFGAAALRMTDRFEMRPKTLNGVPVADGTVRIPLRFILPAPIAPAVPQVAATPVNTEPSPDHLAAAERLVRARKMVDAFLGNVESEARRLEFVGGGEMSKEARETMATAMRAAVESERAGLTRSLAQIYARRLSQEDLQSLAIFQESAASGAIAPGGAVNDMGALVMADIVFTLRDAAAKSFCASRVCLTPALTEKAWRSATLRPGLIDNPQWIEAPSSSRLAGARPNAMKLLGLPGVVRMTCGVEDDGKLKDCQVDEAYPVVFALAPAALELAKRYRLSDLQRSSGGPPASVVVRIGFPADPKPGAFEVPPPRSEESLAMARDIVQPNLAAMTAAVEQMAERVRKELKASDDPAMDAAAAAILDAFPAVATRLGDQLAGIMAATQNDVVLRDLQRQANSAAARAEREQMVNLSAAMEPPFRDAMQRITTAAREAFCKTRTCPTVPPDQRPKPEPAAAAGKAPAAGPKGS